MAKICTQINEWVEEEISKPVEVWEEQTKEECKKSWYNPFGWKWVCSVVSFIVKVIRWVIVKVGKWVVRTVCKTISAIIGTVIGVLGGLWDIIAGIFTLDWRRILDGFIEIVTSIIDGAFTLGRIVLGGDLIDYIISEINNEKLRKYVKSLLEKKYSGDNLESIKMALRVEHGAFGLRLTSTAIRTFIDSETLLERETIPNLVLLHENGDINLKELAGFEFTEGFWNRKRYKTLKKGIVVGGGGGGEFDNPISSSELETYINSRGADGPKFIILSMRDKVLETKLDAADEKGREIGLMISWKTETIEVKNKSHINHGGGGILVDFLIDVIDRKTEDQEAKNELCNPVAVGVFRYGDTLRGIAACLKGSSCQSQHRASGVTFIDNKPDIVWKYVPIHELGHYFGLCHVDGVDRIMYSPKQNKWYSWTFLPNLLYLKGEPKFTLSEAKQAWDYIVENFSAQCLGGIDDIVVIE